MMIGSSLAGVVRWSMDGVLAASYATVQTSLRSSWAVAESVLPYRTLLRAVSSNLCHWAGILK